MEELSETPKRITDLIDFFAATFVASVKPYRNCKRWRNRHCPEQFEPANVKLKLLSFLFDNHCSNVIEQNGIGS